MGEFRLQMAGILKKISYYITSKNIYYGKIFEESAR